MATNRKQVSRRLAAAFVGVGLVAVAAAAPVGADHNVPELTVVERECGEVTMTANWTTDTHQAADAELVLATAQGGIRSAPIGESITVGPFAHGPEVFLYRVWGGEERSYDLPALRDADALQAYLDSGEGRSHLDVGASGVAWATFEAQGCRDVIEVTPVEPTVALFECADDRYTGTITIPEVEGVNYEMAGATRYLEPGTYTAAADVYTIVAGPQTGYVFPYGEETVTYEVTVGSVDACPDGTAPDRGPDIATEIGEPTAPPAPAVAGTPAFTG